jgi:hypothetical protein
MCALDFGVPPTLDLHNMSLLLALALLLLFLLALPGLCCASNSTQSALDRQADALLRWRSSLQSSYDLDSWRKGTSPCNWSGVICSTTVRGRPPGGSILAVSNISLWNRGLNGSLDRLQFAELPHLVHLDLRFNSLWGTIPSTIGGLAKLLFLDLSFNSLNGSIPQSIGNFRKLFCHTINK